MLELYIKSSTKPMDIVQFLLLSIPEIRSHCIHLRNMKLLHSSNAGLNSVEFRNLTVSQFKNSYILRLFCTCTFQEI